MDDDDKEILLKRELEELKVFVQQKKVELKQKSAEYESFRKRKESARKNTRQLVEPIKLRALEIQDNQKERTALLSKLDLFDRRRFEFFQSAKIAWGLSNQGCFEKNKWKSRTPGATSGKLKRRGNLGDLIDYANTKKEDEQPSAKGSLVDLLPSSSTLAPKPKLKSSSKSSTPTSTPTSTPPTSTPLPLPLTSSTPTPSTPTPTPLTSTPSTPLTPKSAFPPPLKGRDEGDNSEGSPSRAFFKFSRKRSRSLHTPERSGVPTTLPPPIPRGLPPSPRRKRAAPKHASLAAPIPPPLPPPPIPGENKNEEETQEEKKNFFEEREEETDETDENLGYSGEYQFLASSSFSNSPPDISAYSSEIPLTTPTPLTLDFENESAYSDPFAKSTTSPSPTSSTSPHPRQLKSGSFNLSSSSFSEDFLPYTAPEIVSRYQLVETSSNEIPKLPPPAHPSRPETVNHVKDWSNLAPSQHQWNTRFQSCLEKLKKLGIQSVAKERMEAITELMHLSEDFVYASRAVGKLIISEVSLPFEEKVIQPITKGLGGRAGGEKYIVHNILFKFSLDCFGLFGGSDLAAAKVSGHELKGLMAYSSLHLKEINIPLMTLVDYRGFRLVAICILPVNQKTLIYGTNNAGVDVVNKDKIFSLKMEEAAQFLNVKKHLCGFKKAVELSAAADIEGHLGTDDKYYLLDFSRTMPPIKPDRKRYENGHLYYLFRREFVAKYVKPLCSDAYSGFIIQDPKMKEHNKEIDEATEHLLTVTIPSVADTLLQLQKDREIKNLSEIVKILHRSGVNLRYIGKVIDALEEKEELSREREGLSREKEKNLLVPASPVGKLHQPPIMKKIITGKEEDKEGPSEKKRVQLLLVIEAIARVIKNELNRQLREKVNELKLPQEVPYRKCAVEFLNKIFGSSNEQRDWWQGTLSSLLSLSFNIHTPPSFLLPDMRIYLMRGEREPLFRRVLDLTALRFSESAIKKIVTRKLICEPVGMLDLIEIGDRVKSMDIVCLSQGNFFYYKSLGCSSVVAEVDMLRQAIEKYNQALTSNINKETLQNCSLAWYRLLSLTPQQPQFLEMSKRSNSDNDELSFEGNLDISRATECMKMMLRADEDDSESLCVYALFLQALHDFKESEKYFMRSIEQNPKNGFALIEYLKFLDRGGCKAEVTLLTNLFVKLIDSVVISPLNGEEIGGVIKVYSSDMTFKSCPMTATWTTAEVAMFVSGALKISYDPSGYRLFVVQGDPSDKEVDLDQALVLEPKVFPWIYLQRSTPCFLYFQVTPPLLSWKSLRPCLTENFMKLKGKYVSTLPDYLHELVKSSEDLGPLIYTYPLLENIHRQEIIELFLKKKDQPWYEKTVQWWVRHYEFSNELQLNDAAMLLTANSRDISERGSVSELLQFRTKIDMENEQYLDTIRQIIPILNEAKMMEDHVYVRDMKKSQLQQMAAHLRFWVTLSQMKISNRDFLYYSCSCSRQWIYPSIQAMIEYEKAIIEWVIDEILVELEPTDEAIVCSLNSFSAFSELAQKSFKLGDFSTSATIVEALISPQVTKCHKYWKNHPNYLPARSDFHTSLPFLYFASSPSSEGLLSNYSKGIQSKIQSSLVLVNTSRLLQFLQAIGPVLKNLDPLQSNYKDFELLVGTHLNVKRCISLFECIKSFGIVGLMRGTGKVNEVLKSWNKQWLEFLVSFPLKNVVPKFLLAVKTVSFPPKVKLLGGESKVGKKKKKKRKGTESVGRR